MQPSKSLFTSVTFWGAVIAALAPALKHIGLSFSSDDANFLAQSLITIVGAAIAVIGRIRASKQVHIIPPSAPTQPPAAAA
jgi:hypothetical protein